MPVLMILDLEGDTERLLAVCEEIERGIGMPDGLLVRTVAPTDGGVVVVNLWASEEQRRRSNDDPEHARVVGESGLAEVATRRSVQRYETARLELGSVESLVAARSGAPVRIEWMTVAGIVGPAIAEAHPEAVGSAGHPSFALAYNLPNPGYAPTRTDAEEALVQRITDALWSLSDDAGHEAREPFGGVATVADGRLEVRFGRTPYSDPNDVSSLPVIASIPLATVVRDA
jgi:hypothetical protein